MRIPTRSLTSARAKRGAVVLLAGTLVAAALAVLVARPAGANQAAAKPAAAGEDGPGDDLDLMQGTWERQIRPEEQVAYKRCVKQIGRGTETVTYYGADGAVQRRTTVDFELERHGPVRVYTFFNHVVTDGPDKGARKPERRSYIYRLNGDELAEVWGFMPGQEQRPVSFHIHRRVKPGAAAGGAPVGNAAPAAAPSAPKRP